MEQVNIPEVVNEQASECAAVIADDMISKGYDPLIVGITGAIIFASASKATGLESFTYQAADGHTVKITVEHEGADDA